MPKIFSNGGYNFAPLYPIRLNHPPASTAKLTPIATPNNTKTYKKSAKKSAGNSILDAC